MSKTVLVTGGAGYIGSHTALALTQKGEQVVIVDNLMNSSAAAVAALNELSETRIEFREIDLCDRAKLDEVFKQFPIEQVIHFAGLKAVGESVSKPLSYYQNNLVSTINLLEVMEHNQVRDLVFSSSATVYGDPEQTPISETARTAPTNPYGHTKLMIEQICQDLAASDPSWALSMLRYFNPVGAHESGSIGEDPKDIPNNLVPFVMQVLVGRRPYLEIYGDDWDTPDGTGVRDYIHVSDLAAGHIAALDNIKPGCEVFNLGTGSGSSVLEVIETAAAVSGKEVPYEFVPRRDGDVAQMLANPAKAKQDLGWKADRSLEAMLVDSWRWQSNNPMGFKD